jgi:hypothetical protein
MQVITDSPTDNLLSYQLKDSDLGNICKVRLKTDRKSLLRLQEGVKNNLPSAVVHIRKVSMLSNCFDRLFQMRLADSANGDEIRFPSADVEMGVDSIIEFPAFWPDRPPLPSELLLEEIY